MNGSGVQLACRDTCDFIWAFQCRHLALPVPRDGFIPWTLGAPTRTETLNFGATPGHSGLTTVALCRCQPLDCTHFSSGNLRATVSCTFAVPRRPSLRS